MIALSERIDRFPDLRRIVDGVLEVWPDHEPFLEKSFTEHQEITFAALDRFARLLLVLAEGDVSELAAGYRATCEMLNKEQIHFFRTGEYRCKRFA